MNVRASYERTIAEITERWEIDAGEVPDALPTMIIAHTIDALLKLITEHQPAKLMKNDD